MNYKLFSTHYALIGLDIQNSSKMKSCVNALRSLTSRLNEGLNLDVLDLASSVSILWRDIKAVLEDYQLNATPEKSKIAQRYVFYLLQNFHTAVADCGLHLNFLDRPDCEGGVSSYDFTSIEKYLLKQIQWATCLQTQDFCSIDSVLDTPSSFVSSICLTLSACPGTAEYAHELLLAQDDGLFQGLYLEEITPLVAPRFLKGIINRLALLTLEYKASGEFEVAYLTDAIGLVESNFDTLDQLGYGYVANCLLRDLYGLASIRLHDIAERYSNPGFYEGWIKLELMYFSAVDKCSERDDAIVINGTRFFDFGGQLLEVILVTDSVLFQDILYGFIKQIDLLSVDDFLFNESLLLDYVQKINRLVSAFRCLDNLDHLSIGFKLVASLYNKLCSSLFSKCVLSDALQTEGKRFVYLCSDFFRYVSTVSDDVDFKAYSDRYCQKATEFFIGYESLKPSISFSKTSMVSGMKFLVECFSDWFQNPTISDRDLMKDNLFVLMKYFDVLDVLKSDVSNQHLFLNLIDQLDFIFSGYKVMCNARGQVPDQPTCCMISDRFTQFDRKYLSPVKSN